jgi:hypothetical protein
MVLAELKVGGMVSKHSESAICVRGAACGQCLAVLCMSYKFRTDKEH